MARILIINEEENMVKNHRSSEGPRCDIPQNKFMYMAELKALWKGPMITHRLCNMKNIWVEVASLAITSWIKGCCQEQDNNLVVDARNFLGQSSDKYISHT